MTPRLSMALVGLACAAAHTIRVSSARAQTVEVVNLIPVTLSGETNQDSEPDIAVDPNDPDQIVATAFTPNPSGATATAPIYISQDGGDTWVLNNIVPSANGMTADITVTLSRNNVLYAGILRGGASLDMRILRSANYTGVGPMIQLLGRTQEDQPYARSFTPQTGAQANNDLLYVGHNDFNNAPQTASFEQSLNAATAAPPAGLVVIRLERRTPSGQDGPPIRQAIHPDGTVYGVYTQRTASSGSVRTGNIVVVRDDDFGQGPNAYSDLTDPSDLNPGRFVVASVNWIFLNASVFGQERLGDRVSIAVDPRDSQTVYVAWCDRPPGATGNTSTVHVRRSTDGGANWSVDLLTVNSAISPHLAVNASGNAAALYQQLVGTGASQRWQTRFRQTTDGGSSWSDVLLATTPANAPAMTFLPYLGDYVGLTATGDDFYGVFAASNVPDNANFPNGVTYQRNANFTTNTLLDGAGNPVPASIDPFFFKVLAPRPQIQVPGGADLGDVCVGSTRSTALNVCNTGKADLLVEAITSSNPAFSVTSPSSGFPVTISPDFCFPFQVSLSPGGTGPQSTTLTITSNDEESPTTTVTVTGVGTEPDIRVTGSTDFGVTSAWKPAEKTVSVCNTGACNLAVASASVDCADFTLVNNPFPATVSPDSCLHLVVRFTPTLPGPKSCNLTIASDDPDTPVVVHTLTARTPPSVSFHVGLVVPHGTLNTTADLGSSVSVGFMQPLGPNWAWDLRAGFSTFDSASGQPDTDLWTVSANAKFTVNPGDPAQLFLNGGLGVYHFDPGDFEFGGNLGLGVHVPIEPRFAIEGTYNFHSAFTASPSLNFSQIQLGLLISF